MDNSNMHQPPPRPDYFDASHRRSESTSSLLNTETSAPWVRMADASSPEQTPLASPDPFGQNPLPYSSRLSMAETTRSRQSIPNNIEIQSLIQHRSGMTSAWGLHWWTPFCMVMLFVLGITGAVIHHGFYRALDGQEAKNQLWMGRIGTGMAFFTKACLVGSVVLAYKQRIWYSMRRKGMTVGAIDGLFAVVEDPSQFMKWEMISGAKIATLMAVAVWTIPLAAVFSPTTLTSTLGAMFENGMCTVPNLNFTAEEQTNYRIHTMHNGGLAVSTFFVNTTDSNAGPGYFDFFDQPSKNIVRLGALASYLGMPVPRIDGNVLSCGQAALNCSYSISFIAPGYKCAELAQGVGSNTTELASSGAPFDTSNLLPQGDNIYRAEANFGDYETPQAPVDDHGQVIRPLPVDLGVFKTEPVIWVGQSIDSGKPVPANSPYAQWKTEHTPKIFKCEHYETNYTVFFNFTSGQQQTNVTRADFLAPIINTTLELLPNGTANASNAVPTSNWVRPDTDVPKYKLTAAYHAVGKVLRDQLQGTMSMENGTPITKTPASSSKLFDQSSFYPVADLQWQVQSMYEDMILSILSDPHMLVGSNSSVPCVKSRRITVFKYVPEGLWIPYALVITVTFGFLIIGFHSMLNNGVSSDTVFSRILTTTRNPTLDRLSVGACLGSDPFPKELERTKLRFGVLDEESGGEMVWIGETRVEHCGFGTEDQVGPITVGKPYA